MLRGIVKIASFTHKCIVNHKCNQQTNGWVMMRRWKPRVIKYIHLLQKGWKRRETAGRICIPRPIRGSKKVSASLVKTKVSGRQRICKDRTRVCFITYSAHAQKKGTCSKWQTHLFLFHQQKGFVHVWFFFASSTSIQSFPPKQVLHNYLTWCCKIYRHLQNPVRLIPHGRSHPPEQGMCLGMHLAYAGIRSIHMLHERMNNLMNPLSEHHSQREIQPKEFWLRLHVHCIHGRSHMLRFVDTLSSSEHHIIASSFLRLFLATMNIPSYKNVYMTIISSYCIQEYH